MAQLVTCNLPPQHTPQSRFIFPPLKLLPSRSILSITPLLGFSFFVLSFTLSSRSSDLRNPAAYIASESVANAGDPFLRIAAVDDGQAAMEAQVSLLLDDALNPSYASLVWDRLMGTEDEQRLEAALVKLARAGHRVPIKASESIWRLKRLRPILQKWIQQRKAYDPAVMFDLLKQVKEPIDRFALMNRIIRRTGVPMEFGGPYGSCAVVGNSGILLRSRYGELIDSHDAVIRLNYAHIEKFPENVGKKTTMAFINSNVLHECRVKSNCICKPYGELVPTLMYICQPAHILDVDFCSEAEMIFVTDPRLDNLCSRIAKYYSVKGYVEAQEPASGCRTSEDCKKKPRTNSQKLPDSAMPAMRRGLGGKRSLQHLMVPEMVPNHRFSAASAKTMESHGSDLSSDTITLEQQWMLHGTAKSISTEWQRIAEAQNRVGKIPNPAMEAATRTTSSWSRAHDGPAFHYSSGLQAVVVALGICRNVSLFGFGKSTSSPHHYYSPQQKAELRLHDYEAEYRFYRDLQNSNNSIPFLSQSRFPLPPLHIYS